MYKLHYCFMREACQFACFEQNTSADMYPLHCILCSVTRGRGYVGKDPHGLCSRCELSVTSLPACSQADRQQLPAPGAIPQRGTATFHGALLCRHCRSPRGSPASHRDALSPRQPEHHHEGSASSQVNERRPWLVHLID